MPGKKDDKINYSDEQIAALLKGIYDGSITPYDLPESLYYAIADNLKKALYDGYGGTLVDFTGPDEVLLNELRDNVYMFSGAKVFQQINELSLVKDANLKSFADFKTEALKIYEQYNIDWLKTEYSTAIGQGQNAVRWNQVEQQKETLPYLRYSDVEDANECEICAPLGGIVLPVDDPFWDEFMPLNHFNCRCTVEQLDYTDKDKITPAAEVEEKLAGTEEKPGPRKTMQPLFKMNPGKDGYIFSPDHPYFTVAKKDVAFAQRNFGLPIPAKDK